MNLVEALAPEFILIGLGWVLARIPGWDSRLWEPLERITYWVLFPALLFYASARTPLDGSTALPVLMVAVAIFALGVALAALVIRIVPQPARLAGGMFQCGFRFNSYILLALVGRLYGESGLAVLSIIIAAVVPLANIGAVWGLARSGGISRVAREIATNRLIISCIAGLAYSATGWKIPDIAATLFSRFGQASLVLGLLTVGAALTFAGAGRGKSLVIGMLAAKLAVLPALAYVIIRSLDLPAPAGAVLLAFAAMPLPASAYVLTVRLGGDGDVVAIAVTASILASVITLPFWLMLLQ